MAMRPAPRAAARMSPPACLTAASSAGRPVGRSPLRAAHLHFTVSHDGNRTLVTHIFPEGDPIGEKDTVFGVKGSLIKHFEQQPEGTPTPDGRTVDGTWSRVRFDLVLAPEGA